LDDSMKIVSTTFTSNRAKDIIGDALRSVVDWCDLCIVIGFDADGERPGAALDVAREVCGNKLCLPTDVPRWTNDTASFRNYSLAVAARLGADWAIMLDTDERIDLRGLDVRQSLAESKTDVVLIRQDDERYAKEKFFRLPAKHKWVGEVHECYPSPGPRETLPEAVFTELPKTQEQLVRREQTGTLPVLLRQTRCDPKNGRAWFYLGQTWRILGELGLAHAAYKTCAKVSGWDEERAMACFRIAEILCIQGLHKKAIKWCLKAMVIDPGFAEFPWLAGYAASVLGQHERAVRFAAMALGVGYVPKVQFRDRRGWREGPYDIMRFSYAALGQQRRATAAKANYEAAINGVAV
jgi:tetratricopeptide (TPR) repeat protein